VLLKLILSKQFEQAANKKKFSVWPTFEQWCSYFY